jgi:hypothetical protein
MGKYENQIKNAKWKRFNSNSDFPPKQKNYYHSLPTTNIAKKRKYIYLFFLKKKTLVNYNFELPRQTTLMYYIKNNSVTIIRTHLSNYKEKNDGHARQRRTVFLVRYGVLGPGDSRSAELKIPACVQVHMRIPACVQVHTRSYERFGKFTSPQYTKIIFFRIVHEENCFPLQSHGVCFCFSKVSHSRGIYREENRGHHESDVREGAPFHWNFLKNMNVGFGRLRYFLVCDRRQVNIYFFSKIIYTFWKGDVINQ